MVGLITRLRVEVIRLTSRLWERDKNTRGPVRLAFIAVSVHSAEQSCLLTIRGLRGLGFLGKFLGILGSISGN